MYSILSWCVNLAGVTEIMRERDLQGGGIMTVLGVEGETMMNGDVSMIEDPSGRIPMEIRGGSLVEMIDLHLVALTTGGEMKIDVVLGGEDETVIEGSHVGTREKGVATMMMIDVVLHGEMKELGGEDETVTEGSHVGMREKGVATMMMIDVVLHGEMKELGGEDETVIEGSHAGTKERGVVHGETEDGEVMRMIGEDLHVMIVGT